MIPAFGLGILILLIWYLSTKASKLELDESRIKHEKGLLSKERRALSMSSVRTVRTQQSFTDRVIFGVGTVEVCGDERLATMWTLPHVFIDAEKHQQAMCPKSWLVGSPTQITSVNSL